MSYFTMDDMIDEMREIMGECKPKMQVVVIPYLPSEHYMDQIYPYHWMVQQAVALIRKYTKFRPRAWLAYPRTRERILSGPNSMFVSPRIYRQLQALGAA